MRQECQQRFLRHRRQGTPLVNDPGMHHGTCVTHVPWCLLGSLTRGGGKMFPAFPAHAQPAILRIWQEVHVGDCTPWFAPQMLDRLAVRGLCRQFHFSDTLLLQIISHYPGTTRRSIFILVAEIICKVLPSKWCQGVPQDVLIHLAIDVRIQIPGLRKTQRPYTVHWQDYGRKITRNETSVVLKTLAS